jgi:hypothetical protein
MSEAPGQMSEALIPAPDDVPGADWKLVDRSVRVRRESPRPVASAATKMVAQSLELKASQGELPGRDEMALLVKVTAADLCTKDLPMLRAVGAVTLLKAVVADDRLSLAQQRIELEKLRTARKIEELHERAMLFRAQSARINAELEGRYAPGGPAGASGGGRRTNLPARRGA